MDAVIGLGSNLGDREGHLRTALAGIARLGRVVAASSVYESAPVGPPQPHYLNAAVRIETTLDAASLLDALRELERAAGRERRERWGPRTLDLDILWIADQAIDTAELSVPHAELERRAFALAPLLDVAPEAADPRTGASYRQFLEAIGWTSLRRWSSELQQR